MERLASDPDEGPVRLRVGEGIMLFGTIGMEAVLRRDGSVWYYEDKGWGTSEEHYEAREVHDQETWAAVSIGADRFPELSALLPVRPPDAVECRACHGKGDIFLVGHKSGKGIICNKCGRLGWVPRDANTRMDAPSATAGENASAHDD